MLFAQDDGHNHRYYDDSYDDKDHGTENDDGSNNQNHHESTHMNSHDAQAQEADNQGIDSNSKIKCNCLYNPHNKKDDVKYILPVDSLAVSSLPSFLAV